MANLVSPGTQVTVTDESVYGPAGAGTVPMIFIATGQNKVDPTSTETDGIAKFTKSAASNKPILVTSQRELTQYFGNIDFRKVSATVQQGDETNDYGLLAAFSYLGQSSAAYIVRADVDLTALRPQTAAPTGAAVNNTYWLNPTSTSWGIFDSDGTSWSEKTPIKVEIVNSGAPANATAVGKNNEYLVLLTNGTSNTTISYYKSNNTIWELVPDAHTKFAPHYSAPSGGDAANGKVWIKTTSAGAGLNAKVSLYTTASAVFTAKAATYSQDAAPAGTAADTFADGTTATVRTPVAGEIWFDWTDSTSAVEVKRYDGTSWNSIGSTGSYPVSISTTQPSGVPATGTLWHNTVVNDYAVYEVVSDGGAQKWQRVSDVQYSTTAPTTDTGGNALAAGDYYIDTDAANTPAIYRHNGTAWVAKSNADQSTAAGVVFGDITDLDTAAAGFVIAANVLTGGANPLVFPVGTTAINMCRSGNTVRKYNAALTTAWKWRNNAANQADGSGSFGRLGQRKVVTVAMQASAAKAELREETVAFRLISAPGYPELYDEMITLNADRDETAFIIVDAPFRLNNTEAVAWIQGTGASENGEKGLTSKNTYSACYYPHALTTNPSTGDSVVAPASHIALYTYAYSDNASYQWFAPAGLTRGVVQNASNVGYLNSENEFVKLALTQGSRDVMYTNKLNPIARFPAEGVVVFGQKSLHASASALDRVNVARLTAYLRERFAVISRPFLFEPNDESSRKNAKAVFDGFLANVMQQRGVYDYAVVCDTTNNTSARIDANEFYVDVAIEPTKSAEFIYIPIRIVNTGDI